MAGPAEESDFPFDDETVQASIALLNRISAGVGEPGNIAEKCHSDDAFKALPPHIQSALTTAFGYELEDADAAGGRVRLAPESESDGFWQVRPYMGTPDSMRRFWHRLESEAESPIARAQLSDLVLSTRLDPSPDRAELTVGMYLRVAEAEGTDSLYAAMAVLRAYEIVQSRGMAGVDAIWDVGINLLHRHLNGDTPAGGPARLVWRLAGAPSALTDEHRSEFLRLLDLAEARYSHADAADWIADARRRVARDDGERLAATEAQVSRYLGAAAASKGMVKMHWATRAAELARTYGAMAAYEQAVRVMQSIPVESMGWRETEFSIPVPKAAIRVYLRRVAKSDGWRQAISVFLASPSPAGSYESNKRSALAAAKGSIRAVVSTTLFGPHGLPERTDPDFKEGELVRTEQFTVGVQGILLAEELREIRRRFGVIANADITALLVERYGSDPQLAHDYSQALGLFWSERYSDASRLLIPLIEAGMRGLLLRLDQALYRLERGASPGRYPAMDAYLDRLAALGLDPDWERALRVVLLFPGMNLRNMAAHGFRFEFSASEAAVLMRLAGLFIAMPAVGDAREAQASLERPLSPARRRLRRRLGWVWR